MKARLAKILLLPFVLVKALLKILAIIFAVLLLPVLAFVVPIGIEHYYYARMVVPIEWAGESSELYGTKIEADFIEMRSSSHHTPVRRKFVIGKTEKFVLPQQLFLFDGDSVTPENIRLTLSTPEFDGFERWNEETQKWEDTGKKMIFYVETIKSDAPPAL